MKRNLFVISLLALLASFLPAPLLLPVAAADTSFAFTLLGPQTAENPVTGDTLRVTGSGSFDTMTHSITASGSFTHTTASGTLVARGTWRATSFPGFTLFGGENPGEQGGVLQFVATLIPNDGPPIPGVPAIVVCRIDAPPSFPKTTYPEGVRVGNFTDVTRGATLFHLNP
jgi:hypothetical protein